MVIVTLAPANSFSCAPSLYLLLLILFHCKTGNESSLIKITGWSRNFWSVKYNSVSYFPSQPKPQPNSTLILSQPYPHQNCILQTQLFTTLTAASTLTFPNPISTPTFNLSTTLHNPDPNPNSNPTQLYLTLITTPTLTTPNPNSNQNPNSPFSSI